MDGLKGLVQRAVRAKAAEQGQYSLRQLADDSGMHWTHVSNVLRGKRRPTRDVLEAWAVALSPHLDLDEALMAAGQPPTEEGKFRLIARLWQLTGEQWADLERWVGERVTVVDDGSVEESDGHTDQEAEHHGKEHKPAAHA